MEPKAPTRRCLSLARKPAQLPGRHATRGPATLGRMWRRVALGVIVALAAGWVLTGVGGPSPATAARGSNAWAGQGPPRPQNAVSNNCRLHARVTIDRSPAVMVALRICTRP